MAIEKFNEYGGYINVNTLDKDSKAFDPSYPDVQWYDIALYTIWAFFCWLTFPWFGFGYFAKYPVKREELDDEQKSFYDIFQEKNTTI